MFRGFQAVAFCDIKLNSPISVCPLACTLVRPESVPPLSKQYSTLNAFHSARERWAKKHRGIEYEYGWPYEF